jgi:excisionase family DNA binding protein
MTAIPPALYAEVVDALLQAGRPDLVERLASQETRETLTSTEAAKVLGIASATTVKNWLAGGHFPGAYQTAGGHWRFPRHEVEAVKRHLEALREQNRAGAIGPPEEDDDGEPPLL